jgi:hypothetical protein
MAARQQHKTRQTGGVKSKRRPSSARARSRRHESGSTMMLDGMAHGVMNRIKHLSDEAMHVADAGVRDIRDSAKTYMKTGRKRAMKMERALQHRVEQRPIASLVILSVIALVLGMIFWRR